MTGDEFAEMCAHAARLTLASAAAHEDADEARLLEMAADDLLKPTPPELADALREALDE